MSGLDKEKLPQKKKGEKTAVPGLKTLWWSFLVSCEASG